MLCKCGKLADEVYGNRCEDCYAISMQKCFPNGGHRSSFDLQIAPIDKSNFINFVSLGFTVIDNNKNSLV